MTQADFTETIGLCQVLPGPNIGNASFVLGMRWFGIRGAIVAFLGLFGLPYCWVLGLALLYAQFASNPVLNGIVTGVGAGGAGLFLATAFKLGRPVARNPAALALIAGCFLAVALGRLSIGYVMPVAILIGIVFAKKGVL